MRLLIGCFIVSCLACLAVFPEYRAEDQPDPPAGIDLGGQLVPPDAVKADRVVVIGATWCGPCQTLKPRIEKLKREGYDIKYVDIDDWKGDPVSAVPTSRFSREDTLLRTSTGAWSIEAFKATVRLPLKIEDEDE